MKPCFLDSIESLFADFKNKDDIVKQISKLQVSDSTVTRHAETISEDLFTQLCSALGRGYLQATDDIY